jgi:hypothetical protein
MRGVDAIEKFLPDRGTKSLSIVAYVLDAGRLSQQGGVQTELAFTSSSNVP